MMVEKLCRFCNKVLPIERFSKNYTLKDGHSNKCRACQSAYDKANGARKLEMERLRMQTNKGKEVRRRANINARQRHPEQVKAHNAITNAVRDGKLPHVSTQVCQKCGNKAQQYHHHSYDPDFWLDVVPLCIKCHRLVHEVSEKEMAL